VIVSKNRGLHCVRHTGISGGTTAQIVVRVLDILNVVKVSQQTIRVTTTSQHVAVRKRCTPAFHFTQQQQEDTTVIRNKTSKAHFQHCCFLSREARPPQNKTIPFRNIIILYQNDNLYEISAQYCCCSTTGNHYPVCSQSDY
jgi:hypothetical protein